MNATFLVTLNVESEAVIPATAEDIDEDLASSGHDVIEVKPWARPTLDLGAAVETAFPTEPPPSMF